MELEHAYAAGLIDGEGCVHLCASKNTYRGRVTIGMTSPALPALQSMQATWGGSLVRSRQATTAWEESWVWTLTGTDSVRLLEAVLPYLRIKQEQARLVLQVESIRAGLERRPNGSGSWTSEARAACSAIKDRLHALNMKGPRMAVATTVEA